MNNYESDDRCKGTDTLAYNSIEYIIDFINSNIDKFHIVAEGDRINCRRF